MFVGCCLLIICFCLFLCPCIWLFACYFGRNLLPQCLPRGYCFEPILVSPPLNLPVFFVVFRRSAINFILLFDLVYHTCSFFCVSAQIWLFFVDLCISTSFVYFPRFPSDTAFVCLSIICFSCAILLLFCFGNIDCRTVASSSSYLHVFVVVCCLLIICFCVFLAPCSWLFSCYFGRNLLPQFLTRGYCFEFCLRGFSMRPCSLSLPQISFLFAVLWIQRVIVCLSHAIFKSLSLCLQETARPWLFDELRNLPLSIQDWSVSVLCVCVFPRCFRLLFSLFFLCSFACVLCSLICYDWIGLPRARWSATSPSTSSQRRACACEPTRCALCFVCRNCFCGARRVFCSLFVCSTTCVRAHPQILPAFLGVIWSSCSLSAFDCFWSCRCLFWPGRKVLFFFADCLVVADVCWMVVLFVIGVHMARLFLFFASRLERAMKFVFSSWRNLLICALSFLCQPFSITLSYHDRVSLDYCLAHTLCSSARRVFASPARVVCWRVAQRSGFFVVV